MLLNKKRTRSIRSLLGSPEVTATIKFGDSDTSDVEVEQPTKRVALQVCPLHYINCTIKMFLLGK